MNKNQIIAGVKIFPFIEYLPLKNIHPWIIVIQIVEKHYGSKIEKTLEIKKGFLNNFFFKFLLVTGSSLSSFAV